MTNLVEEKCLECGEKILGSADKKSAQISAELRKTIVLTAMSLTM